MKYKILLLFFLTGILSLSAYSQTQSGIKSILASIDTFRTRLPAEKLYIHFDKPYYSTGDTIWLKAYLLDAALMTASGQSGIVYMELANDTNKVLLRRMLPMAAGLGRGNIVLNKEEIPEGSYTIRAYTNLMRNFGPESAFKKSLYIGSSSDQSWLVSSDTKISKDAGRDNLRLGLQFQDLNKKPIGFRELQVRVMEGKRVLMRDKVQTDVEGKLDVNFYVPEKVDAKNLAIVAEDLTKEENSQRGTSSARKITIPIPVSRPENTDLQFMSEGGNLVAGIATRVGFKAIGEDGKGANVIGKVYNSSGSEEVAALNSTHKGMGSFELTPKAGETYTARVTLSDGTIKSYPLPSVKPIGTVLRVTNRKESDSLEVTVSMSSELLTAVIKPVFYLIGQYANVVCYGAVVHSTVKVKIPKNLFATGIVHFSLLSADKQPLNERIVYVDHHDNLKISVRPDKPSYGIRDSITLNIQVTDKGGKPVQGSFSIAVTDDAQVSPDSLNATILSTFLLTSDLKGNVEDPGYYFGNANDALDRDLDNLLLTQGWVGYDWQKVFKPITPEYAAEQDFAVKGRVSNVLNKAVAGTNIVLLSLKPLFFMDTLTNNEGKFIFQNFPPMDSAIFKLQARNRKGKEFNVGIMAEEFKPPLFENGPRFMPWYLNSDSTLLNYVNNTITQHEEAMKFSGNLLKEVTITAKKTVKGSKNLNGEGNADITLDDTDAKKAGKINLLELLEKRVPGFYERVDKTLRRFYTLNGFELKVVIDGMDLDFFYTPGSGGHGAIDQNGKLTDVNDHYWYVKTYLEYYSAEDIKGIELMKYGKYSYKYTNEYYDGPPIPVPQYAWLEVTTYSGKGPFMKNTPGTYLFKAMPFAGTKEFYSPKYSPKNNISKLSDLRSTIYWNPDVITDAEGKASISFYSSDRSGTYTIITEGSDMIGNLGSKRNKIIVKSR